MRLMTSSHLCGHDAIIREVVREVLSTCDSRCAGVRTACMLSFEDSGWQLVEGLHPLRSLVMSAGWSGLKRFALAMTPVRLRVLTCFSITSEEDP